MFKSLAFPTVLSMSLACGLLSQSALGGWWVAYYGYDRGCCYYYTLPCPASQPTATQPSGLQTRTAFYPPADVESIAPPASPFAAAPTYQQPAPASYATPLWAAPRTTFLSPINDTSAGRLPWTPSNSGWSGRAR